MRAQAETVRPLASVSALAAFALLQSFDAAAAAALPALVAGAAAAGLRGELDFARRADAASWAFAALLGAWVVGVVAAADPQRATALSVPPLAATIILLLCARARWTPRARDVLLAMLLVGAALQSLQVLVALAAGAAPGADAVRAAAVPWLVAPNDLAGWTCLLALLPGLWTRARTGPARAGLVVPVALLLAAAFAAQSRLALACAALAIAPWLAARHRALAAVAVALAVIGLALAWDKGLASIASRVELWGAALDVGLANPGAGVGPGGFMAALEASAPAPTRLDPRGMPWPHNLPLEAFATLGVPGLAAVLALAVACARRANPRAPSTLGIMAALALVAVLEASLLRTWVWFALALLCGLPPAAAGPDTKDGPR